MKYYQIVSNILKNIKWTTLVLWKWQVDSSRWKGLSTTVLKFQGHRRKTGSKAKTISIPSGPFLGHTKRVELAFFTWRAKERSKQKRRVREGEREERNRPKKFLCPLPRYLKCFLQDPSFSSHKLKFRQTTNTGWVYSFQSTENELAKSVDLPRGSAQAWLQNICAAWPLPHYSTSLS